MSVPHSSAGSIISIEEEFGQMAGVVVVVVVKEA